MNPRMAGRPFLINLPSEIIINILSRLSIRAIISCKCACKQLLDLLSTPEFATSHLSLSTPGLLINQSGASGNLSQIFEFEDAFELEHHNLHYNPVLKFDPNLSGCVSDASSWIWGSVNGLLCLQDYRSKLYDALYICNPITREYIALPWIDEIVEYPSIGEYGFGVSMTSGQYKVLRNVRRHSYDFEEGPCSSFKKYECLVHTVGTRSWRKIPDAPVGYSSISFSLFLNGNLHGFLQDFLYSTNSSIYCFDLEAESFKPFPPPPPSLDSPALGTLGILDDCLCFVDSSSQDADIIVIWVMKEYGVGKSWTKQFVIEEALGFAGLYCDSVYAMKVFKDGDILLNRNINSLFYFSSKTKTCHKLEVVIQDQNGCIEAITHNSSFLSLKSLDAENVTSF
ncbi:F-box protein At3g07870-like [Henckelia pumila]|uniref:F-box protein At3g07870-like n=1 Tax=Henckelia pumila TaxID=405737 RepID=UPI003C6E6CF3